MPRHPALEHVGLCAPKDIAAVDAIPQERIEKAAVQIIMFHDDLQTAWRLLHDFSDQISDEYGIYGTDFSNGSILRARVTHRVELALRKLLDSQNNKST